MLTPEERAAADARGRDATDPYGLSRLPDAGPYRRTAAHRPPAPRNGLGLAAVILAPIGLLFGLVPLTGFIAVVCALIAIPLALAGWARVRKGAATNGKTTITGLILAVGALALGIWGITIVFGAMDDLARDLAGPAPVGAPPVAGSAPVQQPAAASGTAGFGERVTFDNGWRSRSPSRRRSGRAASPSATTATGQSRSTSRSSTTPTSRSTPS